jgi:hypothetical protein
MSVRRRRTTELATLGKGSSTMTVTKRKLIEVALLLEAINRESAREKREKSIRHGHPSTLHPCWARRPLAACRAVLFAQLVDDPSAHPDRFPTEEAQAKERRRLFELIEKLVVWENTYNERLLSPGRVRPPVTSAPRRSPTSGDAWCGAVEATDRPVATCATGPCGLCPVRSAGQRYIALDGTDHTLPQAAGQHGQPLHHLAEQQRRRGNGYARLSRANIA